MRADIVAWIRKDADRHRVYETDPVYHMQAQWLSNALDAMEDAMEVVLGGDPAVEQAMHAAIHAVLGSFEAAEERARQTQAQINIAMHSPGTERHWWNLPGGPLSREQGGS